MAEEEIYLIPNLATPHRPVVFNPEICKGCNICLEACQMDILYPNPEKSKPPLILFPEECWYCGCCVGHCPLPGAIKLNNPIMRRVRWKNKATGEHFRL